MYLFVGKHAQGRVAPVEASKQKGRRGLGMAPSNFELESDLAWREEEVCILIRTVLLPEFLNTGFKVLYTEFVKNFFNWKNV